MLEGGGGVVRGKGSNGHEPERIRVESFGANTPVASNDTAEGRSQNRKVEFYYAREDIIETIGRWRSGPDQTAEPLAERR